MEQRILVIQSTPGFVDLTPNTAPNISKTITNNPAKPLQIVSFSTLHNFVFERFWRYFYQNPFGRDINRFDATVTEGLGGPVVD